ncbi:MAG: hypothetical protein WD294_10315 [Phycisphaeraceae bacterium]
MSETPTTPPSAPPKPTLSYLQKVDRWMALHPFHPRLIPFVVYVLLLMIIGFVRDAQPDLAVVVHLFQIVIVSAMLYRYRRLMPEITLTFHWLALPMGLVAAVAWIGLGMGMHELHPYFQHEATPYFDDMSPVAAWIAMTARLVGMAAVVPVFEEVFFRSALLRALQKPETAKITVIQFLDDLPFIGEYTMRTRVSKWADQFPRPLADAFEKTPLGAVTGFSIVSTLTLWCLISHIPRDWPGTIACGLLFILLVWITNRGTRRLGLGPVIWAHGITNAVLWAYTLQTADWRFL